MRDLILVLGAHAQSGRNAARQLRAAHFYGRVLAQDASAEALAAEEANGVILTEAFEDASGYDALVSLGIPTLMLGPAAEGFLRRYAQSAPHESGVATVAFEKCDLFACVPDGERRIFGAADYDLPDGMRIIADADGRPAAVADDSRKLYLLLSRVERNDPDGTQILLNFAQQICGCTPWWTLEGFIERAIADIRQTVGDGSVACAVSGGLDSTVAAVLTRQALGERAHCIFVDTGLMREGDAVRTERFFRDEMGFSFFCSDISDSLLYTMRGMETMDAKWQIASREISQAIQRVARQIPDVRAIVHGIGAADMLRRGNDESAKRTEDSLPVLEPLRELFKDEVRRVGDMLGLGAEILERQPFPTIGLAARMGGEVTPAKLKMLRTADAAFLDELQAAGMERKISVAYAMLDTVGGKYAVILRALQGHGDGAMAARLPSDLIERTVSRIQEEMPQVRRVLYDFTPGSGA